MSEEKLKLPRSSYEELTKIIKAYGQLNEAAALDSVSKLVALNRTTISANNAFLSSVQIIEGGNKKGTTPPGRRLAQALMHEIPDEIQNAWKAIIEKNEFLTNMILAVRIRRGMEVSSFVSHIAFSSGEKKSPGVLTGARTVVDIIRASGLVREKDDKIIPVTEVVLEQDSAPANVVLTESVERTPAPFSLPVMPTTIGVPIAIHLRIDVKPADLDGLGSKLRNLIEEISRSKEDGADADEKN